MKHSPLHHSHQSLNAQFQDAGEWEMPAHYGDPVAEHLAVRSGVGISDLSHRGKIRITGNDRITWLQSIISNDILPLQSGEGRYSSFMSHKGKILSYFRVYIFDQDVLVEDVGEVGDSTYQAFRKFLLYGTKAKMANCLETWGTILVSGRSSPSLMQSAFGFDVQDLEILSTVAHTWEGEPMILARTEETGEKDFELFAPSPVIHSLWDTLLEVGQSMELRPFGLIARESLRIEAGLPRLGPDLNDHIVPPEANLEGKAFSLTKGCYPGQEVVARMDTYGSVKRRLVGLVVEGNQGHLPQPGAKIYSGNREVGWVTSSAVSPTLQTILAFGFPLRDFTKPDTELTIDIDGEHRRAIVHTLPFVTKPS